jgi:hypothetical protein
VTGNAPPATTFATRPSIIPVIGVLAFPESLALRSEAFRPRLSTGLAFTSD